jgi:hypothetical protein
MFVPQVGHLLGHPRGVVELQAQVEDVGDTDSYEFS